MCAGCDLRDAIHDEHSVGELLRCVSTDERIDLLLTLTPEQRDTVYVAAHSVYLQLAVLLTQLGAVMLNRGDPTLHDRITQARGLEAAYFGSHLDEAQRQVVMVLAMRKASDEGEVH